MNKHNDAVRAPDEAALELNILFPVEEIFWNQSRQLLLLSQFTVIVLALALKKFSSTRFLVCQILGQVIQSLYTEMTMLIKL